jgi:hypothetical protein
LAFPLPFPFPVLAVALGAGLVLVLVLVLAVAAGWVPVTVAGRAAVPVGPGLACGAMPAPGPPAAPVLGRPAGDWPGCCPPVPGVAAAAGDRWPAEPGGC